VIDVYRVTAFSGNVVRLTVPAAAPYPLAHAIRTREQLFIASNEQLRCDHPGLVRVEPADHACATVVLLAPAGEMLGALNVAWEDPHEFTGDERLLIDVVARRCRDLLAA
jgi:hypothetical protein